MQLREYQNTLKQGITSDWAAGSRNVCAVLPTGGGKTPVFASILNDAKDEPSVAIAHRKELVGQISMALATFGVRHRIIGPPELIKYVVRRQQIKLGRDYYSPNAQCAVAAVDTLVRRKQELSQWAPQVRRWVLDEGHHLLRENKWGTAVDMFPNAVGLGVTATPCRADGKGLGDHADGKYTSLVVGPSGRDLINAKYLCEYEIAAPLSDMHLDKEEVGKGGDWSHLQLRKAAKKSHIVGDTVENWLALARGRRTIVFAPDIETAGEMAENFRKAGVKAEAVHGGTAADVRNEVLDRFERGEITVLINVDLFGEGFDVPAVEVVVMARPTESYGLYAQMFGRALRILAGKLLALIIDQVGNVQRHGLPDRARVWSLDAKEKSPRSVNPEDDIPLRYCTACAKPYPRFLLACPYPTCGKPFVPSERSSIEQVDGDLHLLTPEILAFMRGEVDRCNVSPQVVSRNMLRAGAPAAAAYGAAKQIELKQAAAEALKACMSWWGHLQAMRGLQDREVQKLFYHMFGTDVYTAQTLGRNEALELANAVTKEIVRCQMSMQ